MSKMLRADRPGNSSSNITINGLYPEPFALPAENVTSPPVWITFKDSFDVVVAVGFIVCALGILTHVLLLMTILKGGFHRRGSGKVIMHSVIIDLMVCGFLKPLGDLQLRTAQYGIFPAWFCLCFIFCLYATLYASHWALCSLAMNRFVAILYSHQYSRWTTNKVFAIMVTVIWVFSFLACFPFTVGWGGTYGLTKPWLQCGAVNMRTGGVKFFGVVQILGVYVPTILLALLYLVIALKYKFPRLPIGRIETGPSGDDFGGPTATNSPALHTVAQRYELTKILCVSAMWHCICHFPSTIITTTPLVVAFVQNPLLSPWLNVLFASGYAFNPVFFFAVSREYRTVAASLIQYWVAVLRSRFDKSAAVATVRTRPAVTVVTVF